MNLIKDATLVESEGKVNFDLTTTENMQLACDFVERILYLKSKGVKIVTTCHNLTPHYSSSNLGDELYSLSYLYSDYIIHLGKYSLQLFQQMYPKSKNVLIPHHIYDTVYTKTINKEECLAKLRLDTNKK